MRLVVIVLFLVQTASALDVPFIAQKPGRCGPAALAMLATFHGQPVTPDDIAAAIYLPDIHGTLTADLMDYARKFNLWSRQYRGHAADLRQKLAAGIPLLVLGKFGDRYHYFIVLDIDDFARTVTVHTDTRARHQFSQDQFWRVWDRANRWTLLVCPPGKATWTLTAEEHNDLGIFLENTGQFPSAANHYRRACTLTPTNSYYRLNLGNALMKQQLPTEAADEFRQALTADPNNADVMNNLADAYLTLNTNLTEAAVLCDRAAKLLPGHRAYYFDTLGNIRLRQGLPKDAIAAYEAALAATTDRQSTLRDGIRQRLATAQALSKK